MALGWGWQPDNCCCSVGACLSVGWFPWCHTDGQIDHCLQQVVCKVQLSQDQWDSQSSIPKQPFFCDFCHCGAIAFWNDTTLANPWSSYWSAATPGNVVETFVTAVGFMLQEVQKNWCEGDNGGTHSLFKSCLRNSESYNSRRRNQLDNSPSGNKKLQKWVYDKTKIPFCNDKRAPHILYLTNQNERFRCQNCFRWTAFPIREGLRPFVYGKTKHWSFQVSNIHNLLSIG